ncbi:DUF2497 domain-containing protein [Henriciella sp.]|uniref:DUF2497 domain-containing protein n=1 Tax=Henriciella sp. TaxID=1968823 RepID=UPI0026182DB7|nr:DUF2497 domain-containing protein [Henriciella sp.]
MAEKAQEEPTMEEILASIRKIISDEGGDATQETSAQANEGSEPANSEPTSVSVSMTDDDDFDDLSLDDVIEKTGGDVESLGRDSGDDLDPISGMQPETQVSAEPGASMFDDTDDSSDMLHLGESQKIHEDTSGDLEDFDFGTGDDGMDSFMEPAEEEVASFDEPSADWDTGLPETPEAVEPTTVVPEPEPVHEPEPAAAAPQPEPSYASATQTAARSSDGLTDERIAGAAASALGKLMVKQSRTEEDEGDPNTLEGLLKEMLRPMIKEWLDANLPAIVERKVEEEVQRIARMAR